jgi:Protein of unknown function (DUF3225)
LLNPDGADERAVIVEVREVYERYEEALLRHDVESLDSRNRITVSMRLPPIAASRPRCHEKDGCCAR